MHRSKTLSTVSWKCDAFSEGVSSMRVCKLFKIVVIWNKFTSSKVLLKYFLCYWVVKKFTPIFFIVIRTIRELTKSRKNAYNDIIMGEKSLDHLYKHLHTHTTTYTLDKPTSSNFNGKTGFSTGNMILCSDT